jgi:hypothetical protein
VKYFVAPCSCLFISSHLLKLDSSSESLRFVS